MLVLKGIYVLDNEQTQNERFGLIFNRKLNGRLFTYINGEADTYQKFFA